MEEKDAREFITTYRQFCNILETNDVNEVRKALGLPLHKLLKNNVQNADQEGHGRQDIQYQADDEPQKYDPCSQYSLGCPWPKCELTSVHPLQWAAKQRISTHLLNTHLGGVWQCPENDCQYCGYLWPSHLERHRMNCHVGSPLQCGHHDCNQVLVQQTWASRGHIRDTTLRTHFETYFNHKLRNSRAPLSTSDTNLPDEVYEPQKQLPSDTDYMKRFGGISSSYLSHHRRLYRRARNLRFLAAHKINLEDIEVRGSMTCTGFRYRDRCFPCVDLVALDLDTAMLIFVPSLLLFTVAPTCDHCIYVMSLISRPFASLPLPFHFGRQNSRKRIGLGSSIHDHYSFLQVIKAQRLLIPPMAMKYKEIKESSPERIFIVDFESVRRSDRELPLRPTEITARNGNRAIIVTGRINRKSLANAMYENELRALGYTDPTSFRSVRRIRGGPERGFPHDAKAPKEIVDTLCLAGLNSDCL